jgi:hypothetical protein
MNGPPIMDSDETAFTAYERRRAAGNGHTREPRFKPVRFKDIKLNTDRPYLVKGLLPREGLVVIWGPPKCGKSFWTFDVAMHVALGWEYRGRRVQPGSVVYVACEGALGLGARTEAFRQAKLAEDADPPFWLLTTRLDLAADVDELTLDIKSAIAADHCGVIVIDTLNRSIAGSESRDEDMGNYIKAADKLRETFGGLVILIHHCGIKDDRPRGHTSLGGACDAQIAIKRDADDLIIAEVEFMKDGPEGEIVASRLQAIEVGTDEDGEPMTSCVVEEADQTSHSPQKGKPLTNAQGRALQLLADAVDTGGEIPPASNQIPPGKRCVLESVWREYCYRGGISNGERRAKEQAFKRSAEGLIAAGRIDKWEPWVWLT